MVRIQANWAELFTGLHFEGRLLDLPRVEVTDSDNLAYYGTE